MRSPFNLRYGNPTFLRQESVLPPADDGDALDDDDQGYTSLAAPSVVPPPAPEASVSKPQRSRSALIEGDYNALRTALTTGRPTLNAPKWWQRAGGALAGFGAGWSNAAGRTRNPIDIAGMQENILHPGYRQKLEEWQSRLQPLQDVAALDRAQADQERRDRQLDLQEEWTKARSEEAKQHGLAWAARARAAGQGKAGSAGAPSTADLLNNIAEIEKSLGRKLDPDAVNYYVMNKGNMSGYGQTLANPTSSKAHVVTNPVEVLFDPNATPEARGKAQELFNRMHPVHTVDPDIAEGRRYRLEEAQRRSDEAVTKAKQDAEARVHAQRRQEIKTLMAATNSATEGDLYTLPDTAAKLRAINQKYKPALQAIQDNYANSIRRRGGEADDYDINPNTLEATLRQAKR